MTSLGSLFQVLFQPQCKEHEEELFKNSFLSLFSSTRSSHFSTLGSRSWQAWREYRPSQACRRCWSMLKPTPLVSQGPWLRRRTGSPILTKSCSMRYLKRTKNVQCPWRGGKTTAKPVILRCVGRWQWPKPVSTWRWWGHSSIRRELQVLQKARTTQVLVNKSFEVKCHSLVGVCKYIHLRFNIEQSGCKGKHVCSSFGSYYL